MSGVRYTAQAQEDILDIAFYIAQDNVGAAHRLMEKIFHACERLRASPLAGRAREEIAPNLRSLPVGNTWCFIVPSEAGSRLPACSTARAIFPASSKPGRQRRSQGNANLRDDVAAPSGDHIPDDVVDQPGGWIHQDHIPRHHYAAVAGRHR